MKRCSTCGQEKPLEEFSPDTRRRDGRQARCRQCMRERYHLDKRTPRPLPPPPLPPGLKRCPNCRGEKALEAFYVNRARRDGRQCWCKQCHSQARPTDRPIPPPSTLKPCKRCSQEKPLREFYAAAGTRDRHRSSCKQCDKKAVRLYKEEHSEHLRERGAAWTKANPEKVAARCHRRKARKRNAPVNDFTSRQWKEILEYFNHACAYCLRQDVPLTMEHMTPLSRGGENSASNVVPACLSCNASKQARTPLEYLIYLADA